MISPGRTTASPSPGKVETLRLKLFVSSNMEESLISLLAPHTRAADIVLYGKMPFDETGGGRSGLALPRRNFRWLAGYVKKAEKSGLGFNYLLNGTCFDNLEFSISWRKNFSKLLESIVKEGIKEVTVSSPYLLRHLKKHWPSLRVKISTFTLADSIERLRRLEDMGADSITVAITSNRDFPFLAEARKSVNCELELIANLACMNSCAMAPHHANLATHASQKGHSSKGFVIDYCALRCICWRHSVPAEIIKSPFIRPEDLPVYEKMGFHSFKIVERNKSSAILEKAVRAYTERHYEGNLLEIMGPFTRFEDLSPIDHTNIFMHVFRPTKANPFRVWSSQKLFTMPDIYLDNRKLDGFLEGMIKSSIRCRWNSCARCTYCITFANNALDYSKASEKKEELIQFIRSMLDGKLYNLLS